MEQDIYVDILVFLNTVINFFLLLVTAALAGRERKTGRILAAAFLGGIYALILLLPQLNGPVLTLTRIAAAAIMTAVAFPFRSLRTFLFQCGLLYLAGFLFAGLMVAIWILDFHWHHWIDKSGQYFLPGSEHQTGDLCFPLH